MQFLEGKTKENEKKHKNLIFRIDKAKIHALDLSHSILVLRLKN